ncbi:MAG: tRNA pseudouridine(38-40) synthase TruA [Pseudomonadota bacterium]
MRIALGIEYNGAGFHGWQTQQQGIRSVQQTLEQAVATVANHAVRVHCAGRTDTGVHALEQVIHFDTEARRPQRAWTQGVNVNLPDDVSVLWAAQVPERFHARFSAYRRSYCYQILNRPLRSALAHRRATWIHRRLDAGLMHSAAQVLLGTHDFSSYRALGCQAKSPVRTVHHLSVERHGEFLELRIEADAFLHHMVRNIAGVLIAIGQGKAGSEWAQEVLELRDRRLGGVTAPPDGLYLERVQYPAEFQLPETSSSSYKC